MRSHLAILGLALFALPSTLPAQRSPEAAAESLANAMRQEDWAGAARLMHPAALRQLRELFDFILADTADLAETRQELFGVGSAAEAAAAADTTLFANFLRAMLSQDPEFLEAFRAARITALGHVPQGADTALVVSRTVMNVQGASISSYEVMPFVRDGQQWRGLLKADFTNMAAMLRQLSEEGE